MKFMCLCGKILTDNTDALPYKARMVADEDWDQFMVSCTKPPGCDIRLLTTIYQCSHCGCLRIVKPAGNVVFFKPEDEHVSRTLLRSVKSEAG
jgi:hypothetical protein